MSIRLLFRFKSPALFLWVFAIFSIVDSIASSWAGSNAQGFSYQGRISNASGTAPLTETVVLTLGIYDPAGTCLLYEEVQPQLDLSLTSGFFSVQVGSLLGALKRTPKDPGLTLSQVFSNTGEPLRGVDSSDCSTGYTPQSGDHKNLRVTVSILATGEQITLSPDLEIDSVPQATTAETLQGFAPQQFLQVIGSNSSYSVQKTSLDLLLGGSSSDASSLHHHDSLYIPKGSSSAGSFSLGDGGIFGFGTRSSDPTYLGPADAGKSWYDSTTSEIKFWDGTKVRSLQTGAGGGITGLTGDVTGSGSTGVINTTITSIGGVSATSIVNSLQSVDEATASNTAGTLVRRDSSGNFSAGAVTISSATLPALPAYPSQATDAATKGYVDWILGSKENSLSFNPPLSRSGDTISIPVASSVSNGTLSSSDWLIFSGKLGSNLASGRIFVGDSSNLAQGVSLSGDASLSNSGVLTLKNTGSSGTYTKVTTDAQGRVSSGTTLSAEDIPSLSWDKINSSKPTTLSGYGITDSVQNAGDTPSIQSGIDALKPTAGTKGRIFITTDTFKIYRDSGTDWEVVGARSNLNYTPVNQAGDTMSGALTISPATNVIPQTIKGVASQTADLTQWQNSTGTVLAKMDSSGKLTASGLAVTGGTPSVGKVLTSDASGNATWQAPATSGTVTSVSGTAPISVTNGSTTPSISIATANSTTTGALSSTDWTTFNNKLGTALTSGNILVGNASNQATSVALSGDATLSNSGALTLKNTGTSGTYTKVTTDAQGRVTSGSSLSATDIPNLDWTQITTGQPTTLSGYGITDAAPKANPTFTGTVGISSTNTATSGTTYGVQITPTYNQVTSTASNTDLLINRTPTSVGSGSQKLIDAQVGGVSKFSVDPTGAVTATSFSGSFSGNATSATTATNANNVAITNDTATNATVYPTWVTATTGNLPQSTSSTKLSFNPSTGILTATGFSGPLTGNVTGNVSGSAASFTGSLAGDVTGTQGATSVAKINGASLGSTTATSGNLLIGSGTQWVSTPLSGDATLSSSGAITLKNTGTSGTYTKVTTDAQGRITSGSSIGSSDITTALGFTPINKSGDTGIGSLKLSTTTTFGLGNYTTAEETSLIASTLGASDKGKTWYNSDLNQIRFWDGSAIKSLGIAGSGLQSLNGLTGSSQTFATGTSGNSPAFSSSGSTHTLNIPLASTSGVTAGLISKSDYDTFSAKQAALGFTPVNQVGDTMSGALTISPATNVIPQTIKGVASQTADLTQWQNSTGTVLAKMDSSGKLTASGLAVTGGTPSAGKVLTSDASGNATWQAPATSGTVTSVSGTAPISVTNGSATPSISIATANSTTTGALSSTDWTTFNNKLGTALTSGNILVGNASNQATSVALSGDATLSNSGALTLKNTGTSGTYTKVTTDAQGRVTSGSSLSATDIPNLDWTQITTGQPTTLSGYGITDAAPKANPTFTGSVGISSTNTATSGTTYGVQITPTYNQVTSTASNTDLLINRTPTSVGSGSQKLIDAQVGGVSKFSVDPTGAVTATSFSGSFSGNATSATTATNANNVAITNDTATNATVYPTWVTANTGNLPQKTSSTKLSFNPSTGILTATGFSGPLTGNVTGNVSGSAASFTGSLAGDVTGTQSATSIAAATVTGKALTGFNSGAGTLSATDTVLSAIQKLDGNDALKAPLASPTFTGNVNLPGTGIWNSSGNVGIGTMSPAEKLDVNGSARVNGTISFYPQYIAGGNAEEQGRRISQIFNDENGAAESSVEFYRNFGHAGGIRSSSEIRFNTTGSTYIPDGMPVSTKMVIKGNGNVGVGTTNPSGKLHIVGTNGGEAPIFISSYGAQPVLQMLRSNGTQNTPTQTNNGDLIFNLKGRGYTGTAIPNNPSVEIQGVATENTTATTNGGALHFLTTSNGSTTQFIRMTLNHNGNLGIGTATPSAPLQVSNTNTATSGTNYIIQITPTYNQASSTAANTDLLINRTQTTVGSGSQKLIDAQVGGVSKFSVDNTGAVTATSFTATSFTGTFTGSVSGSAANFTGSLAGDVSGTQIATSVDKIKGTTLGTTTATAGNLLIGSGTQWSSTAVSGDATLSSAGVLSLKSTGISGTYTKVTTDAQGRVSSGTTLSASDIPSLDWSKITTGIPTTLSGYGITDAASKASPTFTGSVTLPGTGIWNSSGNVGIGTTSPIAQLQIAGTYSAFQMGSSATASDNFHFVNENVASNRKLTIYNGNLGSGIQLFTVQSTGNVGIGTTAPSGKLEINTNNSTLSYNYPLRLKNTNAAGGSFDFVTFHGATNYAVAGDALLTNNSGNLLISPNLAGKNIFLTGGNWTNTPSVTIKDGGNVGIGTTSPTASLQVGAAPNSTISTQGLFISGAKSRWVAQPGLFQNQLFVYDNSTTAQGVGGAISFGANTQSGGQETWLASIEGYKETSTTGDYSGALAFHTRLYTGTDQYATEKMRITSTGKVGIGTTSPTSQLEVNSNSDNSVLKISTGASGITPGLVISNGASGGRQYSVYSGDNSNLPGNFAIIDSTGQTNPLGGTSRLIIDSSGNVGIGTTNPGEKLEVNGNIKGTAFLYSSDQTLKKDILTIQDPIQKILALRGVQFKWKKSDQSDIGVIAQEVEKVFPQLVHTDTKTGLKSVQYGNLVSVLIEAVKKMWNENQELKNNFDEMKAELCAENPQRKFCK